MRMLTLIHLLLSVLIAGSAGAQTVVNVATGAVDQDRDFLVAAAGRFMDQNPDVSVRVLLMPELTDNRLVLLRNFLETGSPQVDVLQLDGIWTAELAPHLADLSGLSELDQVDPLLLDVLTVDGQVAGVPWFLTKGVLIYRSDLLARYGFAGPPGTWQELERMARTIAAGERQANPDFSGFVFQGGSYEGLTVNAIEWWSSTGGGHIVESRGVVSINNPQAVRQLDRAQAWIGDISPPEVLNWHESEALAAFMAGDAAFMRSWHTDHAQLAAHPEMADFYGIAPLPGSGATGLNGGSGLAVSTYSRNQPEALRLVQFLMSEAEQIRAAAAVARIPTRTGLRQHPEVIQALPFLPEILPRLSGPMRPHRQSGDLWSGVSRATYLAVHSVLSGYSEPGAALQRLAERLQLSTGLPTGQPEQLP